MSQGIHRSFLFNLFMVLAVCFGLYFLFFVSLGFITNHGSEIKVPNVIGRDMRVATEELEKAGYEVIIDSTYVDTLKPFVVVAQLPEVGQMVKKGRTLFITVNKAMPPLIPMPNLNGVTLRSAEMILRSNRLLLGDTTFRPDIAMGAVLEQSWRGTIVRPGMLIPQGSTIDLVLGDGLGNNEFNVPDIIGMTVPEAIAMLQANNLQYTSISDGVITDSLSAIVYQQIPNGLNELGLPNRIREGDVVDFRYKQSPREGELDSNRNPARYLEQKLDETDEKPAASATKVSTIEAQQKPLDKTKPTSSAPQKPITPSEKAKPATPTNKPTQ